jgi:hypothetical protein
MARELFESDDTVRFRSAFHSVGMNHTHGDQKIESTLTYEGILYVVGSILAVHKQLYVPTTFQTRTQATFKLFSDFMEKLKNPHHVGIDGLNLIPNPVHRKIVESYLATYNNPVLGFGMAVMSAKAVRGFREPLDRTPIRGNPDTEIVLTANSRLVEKYWASLISE